tara:strand:+ start:120 stop:620 length:501 start_codon:yes stop_codon:yes gene_type:complete
MWAVFKYKQNNYELVKSSLRKKANKEMFFFNPKISFVRKSIKKNKVITKHVLERYAFCFYENFKESDILSKYKYTKGLEYFLDGHIFNQEQIIRFINLCKKNEDKNGNLNQDFFSILEKNKVKFLNGPFSNFIFKIVENNKNKIKTKLGQLKITINKNSNYFYLPI